MTETSETPLLPPEAVDTSSVMRCYALLGLGMIVGFMNINVVSAIGMGGMLWGIVWAYLIRKKAEAGGLVANHSNWMIRTFWVSSVYAVAAMALWASVIYSNADFSMMDEYNAMLKTGAVDQTIAQNAAIEFKRANSTIMMWATVFCHGPVILFVLARFVKGYRLADAGRPIENLKTWKI